MNARILRARTVPGRSDTYVLITWSDTDDFRQQAIIEWFILADVDAEIDGRRFRARIGEYYPGGRTDLDFWLTYVETDVWNTLQLRVDQEWLDQGHTGWPPSVLMEQASTSEILSLRFQGRGQAGLLAVSEVARDPETRDFVASVLELQPVVAEAIPRRNE